MSRESEKLYYSMGEVAEMLDVTTTLVRFWDSKFDIIKPHKNKKGNRLFSAGDVRNLKTIYHLVRERGMTLAGADKYLKANKKAIERDMAIAERLHSIRALLTQVRAELGEEGTAVEIEEEFSAPVDEISAPTVEPTEIPVDTSEIAEDVVEISLEQAAKIIQQTLF